MKMRVKELCEKGDKLFSKRAGLISYWQELAENFYVERADFTVSRNAGNDFASHLMSGVPVLTRRELADQIAAMIRPRGQRWFSLKPSDEKLFERQSVKDWIEHQCDVMYRAMYDGDARLMRATKECDNDYVTFGQGVMTVEVDEEKNALLYRTWHLRDVAWSENDKLEIDCIQRKWQIEARSMCNNPRWAGKVSSKVHDCLEKDPFKEIECRHIIVPYNEYDYKPKNGRRSNSAKFMSILVDRENETILSEHPVEDHDYVIPRWQTVSGSPYAHSPATVVALPDARLLQRITHTLLEAGEKAVNPPIIARSEQIRSDINMIPGSITWVDATYDEALGEVLRPLAMDKNGLAFGADMAERHELILQKAFYLNKIMLPAYDGKAMTATEIRTRTEEYIRAALPLFEPIEAEYSGQLCEKTWDRLMKYGTFGDPRKIPQELSGADLKWVFQSPLTEALDRKEAMGFQERAQLIAMAAELDPSLREDWDIRKDFRKAMQGLGASMVDEEEADERRAQAAQVAQLQQAMTLATQGGMAGEQVGKAAQALAPDMMQPEGAR